jgi:hypothetical protein
MDAEALTRGPVVPACAVLAGRVLVAMLASILPVVREGGELPQQAGRDSASRRLIQPG